MHLPIATADGTPRTVSVYHVDRGLAVQRDADIPHYPWGVLHVASGKRVAWGLPTRAAARYVQEQLLALDIDWTHAATKKWSKAVKKVALPVVQACKLHQPWRKETTQRSDSHA